MRRKGETLLIGEDIEVTIAHIGRSRVKVGIRAPQQCRVLPGEDKADAGAQPQDFQKDAGIQD
jgi:carbon storage regulator CsrA